MINILVSMFTLSVLDPHGLQQSIIIQRSIYIYSIYSQRLPPPLPPSWEDRVVQASQRSIIIPESIIILRFHVYAQRLPPPWPPSWEDRVDQASQRSQQTGHQSPHQLQGACRSSVNSCSKYNSMVLPEERHFCENTAKAPKINSRTEESFHSKSIVFQLS